MNLISRTHHSCERREYAFMVSPTMNLISRTHHSCERREYAFMILREYTIISHRNIWLNLNNTYILKFSPNIIYSKWIVSDAISLLWARLGRRTQNLWAWFCNTCNYQGQSESWYIYIYIYIFLSFFLSFSFFKERKKKLVHNVNCCVETDLMVWLWHNTDP